LNTVQFNLIIFLLETTEAQIKLFNFNQISPSLHAIAETAVNDARDKMRLIAQGESSLVIRIGS